jgi:plasmid maintenance system antidote protein VapI
MPKPKRSPYQSLHEWLDRTGTQQQTLAKIIGIADSTLSMLLRGSRRCSLPLAMRISEITGVPVEKLVEWPKFQPRRKSDHAA